MNTYNYGFQDGINSDFLIDEYINPNFSNIYYQLSLTNNNTNNLISNEYVRIYNFWTDDTPSGLDYYQYSTYINTSNFAGEVRFYSEMARINNALLRPYNTKIGKDGDLYVWHNYDATNPSFITGWKNVADELSGLFEAKVDIIGNLLLIESQIAYLSYVSLIELKTISQICKNLKIKDKNQIKDTINALQSLNVANIYDKIKKYKEAIGIGAGIIGGISYTISKIKENEIIKDSINSNITISDIEKEELLNYSSNIIEGELYNIHNNLSSNLNYFLGFTTQKQVDTISNEILDNFIDTNKTNTINYSSLNSYPSKTPTTIYTTSTEQVLGLWNAKKRFNLDYTGVSYGVGDYYLYYNTASTNTFINCFDNNISTYGEFSSIYTDNIYDDYLNSQNVYSLGDFNDKGNVLIIKLPYKISLNSIILRSSSDYIGCPINYSIYGANDLDLFYKLHQTTDLTTSTDYPSPNYINTQILTQDSEFYNTFGFIFKKAYQHAPRIYEIKLYGYEVSSRRTLLKNNVGIGINDPDELLHIGGNTKIDSNLYISGYLGINNLLPDERLHITGNAQIDGSIYTQNILTNSFISTSNVGINTYTPTEKLDVVGNIKCSANVNTSTITTNSINSLVYLGTNVGIGITNPSYKLDVNGSLRSSSLETNNINSLIYINNTYQNIGIGKTNPHFNYVLDTYGDARFESLYFEVKAPTRGGIILNSSINVPIYNNNSGTVNFINNSGTYVMSIGDCADSGYMSNYMDIIYNSPILGLFNKGNFIISGNVGIGQNNSLSNPSEKLDVVGNIKCSGNIGIGTTPSYQLHLTNTAKFTDITLSSYIDCYRNTTGSPSNGIYGSSADRIILQRGTVSSHPFSVGIGTNCTYYNVPSTYRHSFMINGITKLDVKGSGIVVSSTDGTDIMNIMNTGLTAGIGIGTNTISSISDVADSITIKSKLTGDINLMVNGTTKLCVDGATGYVGINNTDPYYNLDVNGSLNATSYNSSGAFNIYYANPILSIKATGDTEKATLLFGTPYNSTSALKAGIIAEGIGSWNRSKLHFCLDNSANNTYPTYNASVSNSRMTITNDGYVGIGTTTPIINLEVVGSINSTVKYLCTNTNTGTPTIATWGGNGDRLILYQGSSPTYHPYSLGINASQLWYSAPTGAKHSFYINGTEYFTINSTGSLNVVSDDTYIASFKHTNLTQGIGIGYNNIEAIGTNATQNITIKSKSTGNIYLNTNGSSQLMVSGTGGVEIQNYLKVYSDTKTRTATTCTYINTTSTNYFSGGNFTSTNVCAEFGSSIWIYGSCWVASDERIKKDITDLNSDDSLNKILKLKPKSYKYKDVINNGNSNNYGFIAQEVKEIIPEAVSYKKSFIPNIYEVGYYYDSGIIVINKSINNILNVYDKIKIYDDKGTEYICNITEIINNNSFKIDNKKLNGDKILVYGTEVEDFNILDKEIIFSLNVSATQNLYNKIIELENRIKELENLIN